MIEIKLKIIVNKELDDDKNEKLSCNHVPFEKLKELFKILTFDDMCFYRLL